MIAVTSLRYIVCQYKHRNVITNLYRGHDEKLEHKHDKLMEK